MSVLPHDQYQTVPSKMIGHLPKRAMGVGPTLLRNRNSEEYHQKMVGAVGSERPTDTATSR